MAIFTLPLHTLGVEILTLNVTRGGRSPLDSHLDLVAFCLSLDVVVLIFGYQIRHQDANYNNNTTLLRLTNLGAACDSHRRELEQHQY